MRNFYGLTSLSGFVLLSLSILASPFVKADNSTRLLTVDNISVVLSENTELVPGKKVNINWEFIQDGRRKKAAPLLKSVEIVEIADLNISEEGVRKIKLSLSMTEQQSKYLEVAKNNGTLIVVLPDNSEDIGVLDDKPVVIDLDQIESEKNCPKLLEEFNKIRSNENDRCEKDEDCGQLDIYFCPLGCSEILPESKIKELSPILDKIVKNCKPECSYDCLSRSTLYMKGSTYYMKDGKWHMERGKNKLSNPFCNNLGVCELRN
jgi:hypothetical protein